MLDSLQTFAILVQDYDGSGILFFQTDLKYACWLFFIFICLHGILS
jgi:hypothetical protein